LFERETLRESKDWGDLVAPGISVIVPNPKTSGNGRYSYLAAWAYAKLRPGGGDASAGEFVSALFKNVPVLETGGRAATNTFVQKEIGDVLLTFESEVLQITKVFSPDRFDVIYPPLSILAEAPVSVADKVVDKRGTRQLATDYLEYLWSEDGQKLAAQSYFRPRSDRLLAENAGLFPPIKLVSVDEIFGGWDSAQKTHFADGGFFDQIYQVK
jgi:sulfate transport system substrate-binding protein